MTRNRYKPTEEDRAQVKALAGFGLTIPQIAVVFDKGEKTIRRHFKVELRAGKLVANAKVAQSLFKVATEGKGSPQVTAAIFWMKTQGRWSTLERVEVTGLPNPDGLADLRNLSRDELRQLEKIASKLSAGEDEGARPDDGAPDRSEEQPGSLSAAS